MLKTGRGGVVRGGTPLEVVHSENLARFRDYLDVSRSRFLVRGGCITVCLCGKFD